MVRRKARRESALFYEDSAAHLADELRQLDLLLQRRVLTLRQQRQALQGMAAAKGVYISHEEVDALLDQKAAPEPEPSVLSELLHQWETVQGAIDAKIRGSAERGIFLALPSLAHLFALSPFELQTVMICLAPELRRKYDTLYAYMQDDITRKRPSVDLVLDLLCASEAERWHARSVFADHAPLFRHGILHRVEDPRSPSGSSGLAQFLQLDQRTLAYLLGNHHLDGRLDGYARLIIPSASLEEVLVEPTIKTRLMHVTRQRLSQPSSAAQQLVLYFHGPYGVGKRDLALGLCAQWDCPLLYVDLELLLARETDVASALRLAFREGRFSYAALYVDHIEALLREEGKARGWMQGLAHTAETYGWLTFLAGEKPWPLQGVFDQQSFCTVEIPMPDALMRQAAWERALERLTPGAERAWAGLLANRFRLTPGQIHDAAAWAAQQHAMQDGAQAITLTDLFAACRSQSYHKLGELAVKVEPHYGWEDLVLPAGKLQQLKEICDQMLHRYRVFGEWGFQRKLSHGRGLSVLFAGASGTGKTMAAEVMAHVLQLDLYKIDLSGVVSKYIGETEKNLAKVFQEAESSNAILFFDEADALFGKRTKVSDAHDRYANIETSYLLQRMEAYEGMVILATNLRENMDEAFTRRIRFIVEFPFPNATHRKLIWQTHFPREAPVDADLDYEWLAQQFQITGGNIKNIVLNAAFFAAADGGVIGMAHVLRGARREFEKIGKLWNDKLFIQPHR
jgi:ATP-dependent 26S proteasome regulatory subunit